MTFKLFISHASSGRYKQTIRIKTIMVVLFPSKTALLLLTFLATSVVLVQSRDSFVRTLLPENQDVGHAVAPRSCKNHGMVNFETFVVLDLVGSPLDMTDQDLHLLEESFLLAYQQSASCLQSGAIRIVDEVCIIPDAIDNDLSSDEGDDTSQNNDNPLFLRKFTYLMVARGRCNACAGKEVRLFHETVNQLDDHMTDQGTVPPILYELSLTNGEETEDDGYRENDETSSRQFRSSEDDDGVIARFVQGRNKTLEGGLSQRTIVQVKRGHQRTNAIATRNEESGPWTCKCDGPANIDFIKGFNGLFHHTSSRGQGGGNVAGILDVAQMSLA